MRILYYEKEDSELTTVVSEITDLFYNKADRTIELFDSNYDRYVSERTFEKSEADRVMYDLLRQGFADIRYMGAFWCDESENTDE